MDGTEQVFARSAKRAGRLCPCGNFPTARVSRRQSGSITCVGRLTRLQRHSLSAGREKAPCQPRGRICFGKTCVSVADLCARKGFHSARMTRVRMLRARKGCVKGRGLRRAAEKHWICGDADASGDPAEA